MEFKDIQNYIEQNKESDEVKKYLSEVVSVDKEAVAKEYLSSREGIRLIQSEADKMSAKAIDTFKKNYEEKEVPKLVNEKYNKEHPAETDSDKKIRELQQRIEASENEKKRETLKVKLAQVLNAKKMPLEFSDFISVNSDDEVEGKIDKLDILFKSAVASEVEGRFKGAGHKPAETSGKPAGIITDREGLKGKSHTEIMKLLREGKVKIEGNNLDSFKTN